MTGPSKMCVSDKVFYERLQENEYSDISESEYSSDGEINVKILSGGEQTVSSDEAENVSNNSGMQPDVWKNSGVG
jgi:type IV secretory pathway VirB4 component